MGKLRPAKRDSQDAPSTTTTYCNTSPRALIRRIRAQSRAYVHVRLIAGCRWTPEVKRSTQYDKKVRHPEDKMKKACIACW
jgi:hypothetical protein